MSCTRSLRRSSRLIVALLLAFLSAGVRPLVAQTFDATDLHQPADLNGIWLVHAGDDPAFASPAFDDSHWTPFDATKFIKPLFPNSRPPVLWYRQHVKVSPSQSDLALLEHQIGSAFEVYENGKLLIRVGSVAPYVPHTYGARLLAPIPAEDIKTGTLVIAIRVYISNYEWGGTGPGYAATNLFIGQQAALREHMWLVTIGENALAWVVLLAGLCLGAVALALFFSHPQQREYLWIFLQFFSASLALPIGAYETFHTLPAVWDQAKLTLQFGSTFFSILMYFSIIRMRITGWIRVLFILSGLGAIVFFLFSTLGVLSPSAAQTALMPLAAFSCGVMPVLLLIKWRRGNGEAGILLVPNVLTGLTIYAQIALFILIQIPVSAPSAFRVAVFFQGWRIGPFIINAFSICSILYVLSLSIIIVLRSTRISRQQATHESEMAAAREVQRLILPESLQSVPGFHIESVYQPAQQVGGDFYQILPTPDGGLLLVIGDVAGKGLPAAMLVSVIVGAIRGVADYTLDPSEMLANLNERLIGRGGSGFSTALAARFNADGFFSIANAGHLPPYLDGVELGIPGTLPLGVESGSRYLATKFQLHHGSRLTFYSDGVVEAQNREGEMLGFERGLALSTQPARSIVEAACQFGQTDDITVVAIQRTGSPAAASEAISGMIAVPAT